MKNIHARVMVLVHDALSECALQMYEVFGYQVIERTQNSIANDQREITPKFIQSRAMVLVHDTLFHCALEV